MRSFGFSIIELMLTVTVMGILAAFAIPSFQATIENNRLINCSNKLVAAVQFAKNQAIVLRQTVVVSGGAGAEPNFKVGLDPDGDNVVDVADEMKVFTCDSDDITITPNPDVDYVSYGPSGFRADGQGQVVFLSCNTRGKGKSLTVSMGGSVASKDAEEGDC
ncbi:MAG: GspH/FimT family pseudopilin [Gammaproteobacteria bacterium]|nr:GspH/FimT family pseudopilin [Gammaproteobacteria bacterium]NVK89155.1 GspH/FimT family pseudopilin [Gammaproteobacteria bacterium]